MSAEESLERAEALLARLEETRAKLEATDDPDVAIGLLTDLSALAKDVQAELERAKREAEAGAVSPYERAKESPAAPGSGADAGT